jgi:hypothetical protein
MALNFSELVYGPCQDLFGRPVTFTSTLGNSFSGLGRGIYDSRTLSVVLEDGSLMSDQQTILDIRESEFPVLPVQDDRINIPADPLSGLPALGDFQVADLENNGGGEVTLTLRKIAP